MKEKIAKQVTHWLSVIIIGLTLGLALQFVRAWTEPTQAPPGGNLDAPLNTGDMAQGKTGPLLVNGVNPFNSSWGLLVPNGNVGIGTTGPDTKLDVNGNIFFGSNLDGASISFLANSGKSLMGWNRSAGAGEIDFFANRGGGGVGGFRFIDYTNAEVENTLVTMQGDGNVGIGTASPVAKLDVNGSIRAGNVYSVGWMQAPIFYDANDNGYYVDPNGGSRVYQVVPSRINTPSESDHGDNSISAQKFCLGGDCRSSWPSGGTGNCVCFAQHNQYGYGGRNPTCYTYDYMNCGSGWTQIGYKGTNYTYCGGYSGYFPCSPTYP